MTTKPTYEELAQTVLTFDETLKTLYKVLGKNPTSESGSAVNLLLLLNPLWDIDATVAALRDPGAQEPEPAPAAAGIQNYLENFDEYSFTDLLLRDLINTERRRQEKNCPVVQSDEEIEQAVRDGLEASIGLAVMIVQALSYAAKGETK
ncbi:hypothetical protein HQ81_0173 [Dickeya phage phiDP23.1]|uniref:DUF7181 domain-containing protein n=17 Tax=Aglimvirinae TaxID=2169530 RepID=I0J372_9CAUD|nr:hypothetical protein G379_gp034 [Dickeya phage vB-DsoM-LIMEstone1]YP_009102999.1 hypothetical protein DA66_0160 [Dickeya phage RC-2014]AIM51333.1 hypothetical protein HQ80_0002 [Dickeya phage phiD3]AIM51532.1 hypothetical protein HQ82_0046 [Dickeya phage phiDP10.3]AIM51821.1 hypothetical protein HQ81_0173 [Dickeya phage phiDP23.1]ASD51383.1 hypothetical protein [Dickeya phage JA15]ASD51579.1 hypothetical protein [Dickeya phage XF4]ATW62200.1 hypothetical protein [Dickeya phage PP35]AYN55